MKPNRVRQSISEGRIPFGHMLMEFDTPGIAKLCDLADLDFVLIDMEHGPLDISQVAGMISRFKATATSPIVRIPAAEYHFVARVMDAGAHGIMAPNVRDADEARLLNEAMRYAPEGKRGLGLGTAHNDFVRPDPASYMAAANRDNFLICQIESTGALRNLDRIASEPGVDCLWVGHMDLTQSMGIVGQLDHADFLTALGDVVQVARNHGQVAGIQPGSAEQAAEWMKIGFDMISYGADIAVYGTALVSGIDDIRRTAPGRR